MIKTPYSKKNIARVAKIDFWALLQRFDDVAWKYVVRPVAVASLRSRGAPEIGSSDVNHVAVDILRSIAYYDADIEKLPEMSPDLPGMLDVFKRHGHGLGGPI